MAHVLCWWRDTRVSLYVILARSDREENLEIVSYDEVIWSKGWNSYAPMALGLTSSGCQSGAT